MMMFILLLCSLSTYCMQRYITWYFVSRKRCGCIIITINVQRYYITIIIITTPPPASPFSPTPLLHHVMDGDAYARGYILAIGWDGLGWLMNRKQIGHVAIYTYLKRPITANDGIYRYILLLIKFRNKSFT